MQAWIHKKNRLTNESVFECVKLDYALRTLAACGPRAPCSTSKDTS